MRQAFIVFGLGFGDCGKGSVVDFLARDRGAGLVVRFNGGAQAGHNVVTPDGRHHTFSQFGSGTFVPDVRTHLGPAFVLHPGAMLLEARKLESSGVCDAFERTTIDARALVVTPFEQAAGRLREVLRGEARHGTCGVGVGEAVSDALAGTSDGIHAADLARTSVIRANLESQRKRKLAEIGPAASRAADPRAAPEFALLEDQSSVGRVIAQWTPLVDRLRVLDAGASAELLRRQGTIIFEGAQGVLLDQTWGFHPHTTWSDCTPAGALEILRDSGFEGDATRLGVTRAYSTRHGEGPFPTWSPAHTTTYSDPHNPAEGWQGRFRTGPLDLVLLGYAAEVTGGMDGVAVTCLDQVGVEADTCVGYFVPGEAPDPILVESGPGGPVRRLLPGNHDEITHRERLGEILRGARPSLSRFTRKALLEEISRATAAPILLESSGPTAGAKRRVHL